MCTFLFVRLAKFPSFSHGCDGVHVDYCNDWDSDLLPDWLLKHKEMIFPLNCVEKKGVLGHGQYGMVHKGAFHHGNAV